MKRHFLMQLHKYVKGKHHPSGWFISEKLDGRRAFWDGGISRGVPKNIIPWANTDKDERYQDIQIATGLWSRYGNVIHAPDWWLDQLPYIPLDGELWIDRGKDSQQKVMSTTASIVPDIGWNSINYMVYGFVPYESIFATGNIDIPNFRKKIDWNIINDFISKGLPLDYEPKAKTSFQSTVAIMEKYLKNRQVCYPLKQERLPFNYQKVEEIIESELDRIESIDGEGLVLRKPESVWIPERSHYVLKIKSFKDMEGTVIGYITGRETDKGSKLLGMMGALILRLSNGVRLELSGFTDQERELGCSIIYRDKAKHLVNIEKQLAREWASENPETECPDWIEAINFPRGTQVTFKYRDISRDGVPVEARYWRGYNND